MEESPPGAEEGLTPSSAEPRPTTELTPMQQFDRAFAVTESIAPQLDQQLLGTMRDIVIWRHRIPWRGENGEEVEYRITTTATGGSPRTLEVESGPELTLFTELDENGTSLGTVAFLNEDRNETIRNRIGAPMVIGYTSPDDPHKYRPIYLDGKIDEASTTYGYTSKGSREFSLHRGRYVVPGMEHLPSPLDKGAEINDMVKRGTITHRRLGYNGEWQPFTPKPPTPPAATPTA